MNGPEQPRGLPPDDRPPPGFEGPPPDDEKHLATPRLVGIVLAGALAIALVTIGAVLAFGGGNSDSHPRGTDSSAATTGCRIPSGGQSGTEALPGVMTELASSLGSPDVAFTQAAGGTTVYVYCYNSVAGGELGTVALTLQHAGYAKTIGQHPTAQVVYQKDGARPYAVALTVTGSLNATQPGSADHGGLSVTWTDVNPGPQP